jgi:putative ABC transport system permease protein
MMVATELRPALRSLRRSPGFTLVALLTLALGIAAATAIFTLLDRVVLQPLPYPEPEQLVHLDSPVPGYQAGAAWGLSDAGYFYFREHARSFQELGATTGAMGGPGQANLVSDAGAQRIALAPVTATLLEVLRARPAHGRLIGPEDDRPGAAPVALLGHGFWRRQFGGDPGVVGTTIDLDGVPAEVVGVLAPGFDLPDQRTDVWTPLQLNPAGEPVNWHRLVVVGRLRDGVAPEQAGEELARLTTHFEEQFPNAYGGGFVRETGFTTRVTPLRDQVVGDTRGVLWMLFGAVGLVLLIACANVANLFLVRAEARRREIAIRTALGATGQRLARFTLAESLLLTLLAAALAIPLADAAVRLLLAVAPAGLPRLDEVGVGARAALFAVGVALLAGVVFGLIPLLRRGALFATIRDGGRTSGGAGGRQATRRLLVVGQVALALVLLAGAGLLLRSFQELRGVQPGFDAENVLTFEISLPPARYGDERGGYEPVFAFHREFLARLEAIPGVQSAGATTRLPLKDTEGCAVVFLEDRPLAPGQQPPCVATPTLIPGFFETLRIPVRGHVPTWGEIDRNPEGVVLTRALADRLWPGEDPIGKGIKGNGARPPFYRVVGVTGDFRGEGLERGPSEAVYFPMRPLQGTWLWSPPFVATVVVRAGTTDPRALLGPVRAALAGMDPTVPIAGVQTMQSVVDRSMARLSLIMVLLGLAAGMALLLSVIGLYGVIAYLVAQRWVELGIRMALGARPADVVALVMRQGMAMTLLGIGIGLTAALASTRLLAGLLYGVTATDPVAFAGMAVLLAGVALLACYLPARRAVRVDPMVALRSD